MRGATPISIHTWLAAQRLRQSCAQYLSLLPAAMRTILAISEELVANPHTHRQSHSHTLTHTHSHTPEEINDCDLLHLIAHKPGPCTCSNNFWLSHLSRFASMCGWAAGDEPANERTNEHLRFTVPPINLRPPSRVWPSATDASLKPISMRDMGNRPTRGCQTATTAAGAAASTFHFPLYIWFIWSIANKFESSKVLQIHLKVRP